MSHGVQGCRGDPGLEPQGSHHGASPFTLAGKHWHSGCPGMAHWLWRRVRERPPARGLCCPIPALHWGPPHLSVGDGTISPLLSLLARLDGNQFQDPGMELLGSMLSGKDCRVQRIR